MSNLPEPLKKRRRVVCSMYKRLEALEMLKNGITVSEVANSFGVSRSTVCSWKRKLHEVESFIDGPPKLSASKRSPLDDALYVWYLSALDRGELVTWKMLQDKAKEMNSTVTGGQPWVPKWRRRHGFNNGQIKRPSHVPIPYPAVFDRLHHYQFRNQWCCQLRAQVPMLTSKDYSVTPSQGDSPLIKGSDEVHSIECNTTSEANSPKELIDKTAELEEEDEAVKEIDNLLSGFQQKVIYNDEDDDEASPEESPNDDKYSEAASPMVLDEEESQETTVNNNEESSESCEPSENKEVDRFLDTGHAISTHDMSHKNYLNELPDTGIDDRNLKESFQKDCDDVGSDTEKTVGESSEEETETDSEESDTEEKQIERSTAWKHNQIDSCTESTSPTLVIDTSQEYEVETSNKSIEKDDEESLEEETETDSDEIGAGEKENDVSTAWKYKETERSESESISPTLVIDSSQENEVERVERSTEKDDEESPEEDTDSEENGSGGKENDASIAWKCKEIARSTEATVPTLVIDSSQENEVERVERSTEKDDEESPEEDTDSEENGSGEKENDNSTAGKYKEIDRSTETTSPTLLIDSSQENVERGDKIIKKDDEYRDKEHMLEGEGSNVQINANNDHLSFGEQIIEISDISEDEDKEEEMEENASTVVICKYGVTTLVKNVVCSKPEREIIVIDSSEDEEDKCDVEQDREDEDDKRDVEQDREDEEESEDDVIYVGNVKEEVILIDSEEES